MVLKMLLGVHCTCGMGSSVYVVITSLIDLVMVCASGYNDFMASRAYTFAEAMTSQCCNCYPVSVNVKDEARLDVSVPGF